MFHMLNKEAFYFMEKDSKKCNIAKYYNFK